MPENTLDEERAVTAEWISRTAHPLTTAEPSAPLDEHQPLIGMVGDAAIVGIGAGTRGARELAALQLRVAKLMVGQAGFRAIALDMNWAPATRIDAFVRTGAGDPRAAGAHRAVLVHRGSARAGGVDVRVQPGPS